MDAEVSDPDARPLALVGTFAAGVMAGGTLGALTNAINGAVSPEYFIRILGWHDVEDVWRASIAQGIFEGLLYGLCFAVILTTVVGVASRGRCPFRFAATHVAGVAGAAFGCWAIGGCIAMGLATLSPDFYRHAFIGVPEETREMLRYAWVGGSIWGAIFGGLASVILGAVLFPPRWRRFATRPAAGP